ncbi:MAG TPA: hypothetical protein PK092_10860 [Chitinophagaceae bacterium]|nr:hypothetical protein [Chitinophagaceae bacterium]
MASHTYNCSQQDLYTIARLGWHSCSQYLTAFQQFSPVYTPAYIDAALAQVDAAQNLPGRKETTRTLLAQVKQQASQCFRLWQLLKRYITKAFPQDELSIRLSAAGAQQYRKAYRGSWQHCTQLLQDAQAFINNHQGGLLANNIMPPSFPSAFSNAAAVYHSLLKDYYASSQLSEVDTQAKILANNAVHRQLMQMLADGQHIFKRNTAVKHLFTFDQMLITLSAPHQQAATQHPIPG